MFVKNTQILYFHWLNRMKFWSYPVSVLIKIPSQICWTSNQWQISLYECLLYMNAWREIVVCQSQCFIWPIVVPNQYDFSETRYSEKCLRFLYILHKSVWSNQCCLGTNFTQNVFFYIPQKKQSHTGPFFVHAAGVQLSCIISTYSCIITENTSIWQTHTDQV